MIYSKKEKMELVKKIMNVIEKISSISGLSMSSIGRLIRATHISMPYFFLFALIYGPFYIAVIVPILLFIIILMFFILNGCIMSQVEMDILKDGYCIADPTLEILRMEINKRNRYRISYVILASYVVMTAFIMYWRFIKN